jgi:hypothetical protein
VALDLSAGEATTFDLRTTVADLRLRQVGVYPLQVQVRGQVGQGRRGGDLGLATTFVPWFPSGPPSPTRIAFLWPLAAEPTRAPDGALLGSGLLTQLSDGGRLDRLLEAASLAAAGACDDPAEPAEDTAPGAGPAAPPAAPRPACRCRPAGPRRCRSRTASTPTCSRQRRRWPATTRC